MPSLNRVQLIGNLGRDPEARFTANGKKYATFTLAVAATANAFMESINSQAVKPGSATSSMPFL